MTRRHETDGDIIAERDAIAPVEGFGSNMTVMSAHRQIVAERRHHAW
jgi:hypothetical protein